MGLIKPSYVCMLTLAMDIVGGKWKMVILWQLRNGVARFRELKRLLNGITQKMLTQQLRELEEAGLITRTVYPVVPPKVEYRLAEEGTKLIPALDALCQWSTNYASSHGIVESSCCATHMVEK
ncbi:winged helix-turn-helix transcriptional regulator [Desulfovibrio cuneatus]|uniref:winged helix-turn-helix transcriptional regulator n=1 Tax=Desulfovibrio cuneatus TaxID=159728 RepID=UPI000488ABAE|nr:helix-turn-helix domain-containing protein [Desulfovibrio cuneatus]